MDWTFCRNRESQLASTSGSACTYLMMDKSFEVSKVLIRMVVIMMLIESQSKKRCSICSVSGLSLIFTVQEEGKAVSSLQSRV